MAASDVVLSIARCLWVMSACRYLLVVAICLWPSQRAMTVRSLPASRRRMAAVCRSVCMVTIRCQRKRAERVLGKRRLSQRRPEPHGHAADPRHRRIGHRDVVHAHRERRDDRTVTMTSIMQVTTDKAETVADLHTGERVTVIGQTNADGAVAANAIRATN